MRSNKKGKKPDEKEESQSSTIPFFFEQMERQMEMWNELIESEEGTDAAQAGLDFAQISSRHMANMFRKIGEALPRTWSTEEGLEKSKEIYQICARSYSEMFKEAMVTPSVLKQNAKVLDAFLDWKIETDNVNRGTLSGLGLPTRDDMDEIAEKLYHLDRKMDGISRDLNQLVSKSEGTDKR
ncbi:MAG: hypothetical protein E3J35_09020 [Methanomassiliicoccales archaeon]|nr:MAG: hypothetical protein E3J35_09020 [Methanomassiliicoccales archaeon]